MNPDSRPPHPMRSLLPLNQIHVVLLMEMQRLGQAQEILRRWNAPSSPTQRPSSHPNSTESNDNIVLSDCGISRYELTTLAMSPSTTTNATSIKVPSPRLEGGGGGSMETATASQHSMTSIMNVSLSGYDNVRSLAATSNLLTVNVMADGRVRSELVAGVSRPNAVTVLARKTGSGSTPEGMPAEKDSTISLVLSLRTKRSLDRREGLSSIPDKKRHQRICSSGKRSRTNRLSASASLYSAALSGTLDGCFFPLPPLQQEQSKMSLSSSSSSSQSESPRKDCMISNATMPSQQTCVTLTSRYTITDGESTTISRTGLPRSTTRNAQRLRMNSIAATTLHQKQQPRSKAQAVKMLDSTFEEIDRTGE